MTDFIEATKDMQHRETLVGGYRTGGLGEVKYMVDREPFKGSWGRPQRVSLNTDSPSAMPLIRSNAGRTTIEGFVAD